MFYHSHIENGHLNHIMTMPKVLLHRGLPHEIVEYIIGYVPRHRDEASGTIHAKFKKPPPRRRKTILKPKRWDEHLEKPSIESRETLSNI